MHRPSPRTQAGSATGLLQHGEQCGLELHAAFGNNYSLRKQAWQALRTAEKAFPHGLSLEMPSASGMPLLDPASLAHKLEAKRTAVTTALILPLVKWHLHRLFKKKILAELSTFLWLRDSVGVLKKAFESAADIYRVQRRTGENPISQGRSQISTDLERLKGNR